LRLSFFLVNMMLVICSW